jgi:large subunit ribosomal protein L23
VDPVKQSDVLIKPYYTEKSTNYISGTRTQNYKDGNKIEFIVHRNADKQMIKTVFEERFEVKVDKVWVRIQKDGKHAVIKLADGYSAEDVAMRVGIF